MFKTDDYVETLMKGPESVNVNSSFGKESKELAGGYLNKNASLEGLMQSMPSTRISNEKIRNRAPSATLAISEYTTPDTEGYNEIQRGIPAQLVADERERQKTIEMAQYEPPQVSYNAFGEETWLNPKPGSLDMTINRISNAISNAFSLESTSNIQQEGYNAPDPRNYFEQKVGDVAFALDKSGDAVEEHGGKWVQGAGAQTLANLSSFVSNNLVHTASQLPIGPGMWISAYDRTKAILKWLHGDETKGEYISDKLANQFEKTTPGQVLQDTNKWVQEWNKDLQTGINNPTDPYSRFVKDSIYSILPNVVGMGVTAATKNPAYALILMGATSSGAYTQELLDKGVDKDVARWAGLISGIFESGTELIPMESYAKMMFGKQIAKNALVSILTEVPGEELTSFMQLVTDAWTKNDYNGSEDLKWFSDTLWQTLFQSGVLMGSAGAVRGSINLAQMMKDSKLPDSNILGMTKQQEKYITKGFETEDKHFDNKILNKLSTNRGTKTKFDLQIEQSQKKETPRQDVTMGFGFDPTEIIRSPIVQDIFAKAKESIKDILKPAVERDELEGFFPYGLVYMKTKEQQYEDVYNSVMEAVEKYGSVYKISANQQDLKEALEPVIGKTIYPVVGTDATVFKPQVGDTIMVQLFTGYSDKDTNQSMIGFTKPVQAKFISRQDGSYPVNFFEINGRFIALEDSKVKFVSKVGTHNTKVLNEVKGNDISSNPEKLYILPNSTLKDRNVYDFPMKINGKLMTDDTYMQNVNIIYKHIDMIKNMFLNVSYIPNKKTTVNEANFEYMKKSFLLNENHEAILYRRFYEEGDIVEISSGKESILCRVSAIGMYYNIPQEKGQGHLFTPEEEQVKNNDPNVKYLETAWYKFNKDRKKGEEAYIQTTKDDPEALNKVYLVPITVKNNVIRDGKNIVINHFNEPFEDIMIPDKIGNTAVRKIGGKDVGTPLAKNAPETYKFLIREMVELKKYVENIKQARKAEPEFIFKQVEPTLELDKETGRNVEKQNIVKAKILGLDRILDDGTVLYQTDSGLLDINGVEYIYKRIFRDGQLVTTSTIEKKKSPIQFWDKQEDVNGQLKSKVRFIAEKKLTGMLLTDKQLGSLQVGDIIDVVGGTSKLGGKDAVEIEIVNIVPDVYEKMQGEKVRTEKEKKIKGETPIKNFVNYFEKVLYLAKDKGIEYWKSSFYNQKHIKTNLVEFRSIEPDFKPYIEYIDDVKQRLIHFNIIEGTKDLEMNTALDLLGSIATNDSQTIYDFMNSNKYLQEINHDFGLSEFEVAMVLQSQLKKLLGIKDTTLTNFTKRVHFTPEETAFNDIYQEVRSMVNLMPDADITNEVNTFLDSEGINQEGLAQAILEQVSKDTNSEPYTMPLQDYVLQHGGELTLTSERTGWSEGLSEDAAIQMGLNAARAQKGSTRWGVKTFAASQILNNTLTVTFDLDKGNYGEFIFTWDPAMKLAAVHYSSVAEAFEKGDIDPNSSLATGHFLNYPDLFLKYGKTSKLKDSITRTIFSKRKENTDKAFDADARKKDLEKLTLLERNQEKAKETEYTDEGEVKTPAIEKITPVEDIDVPITDEAKSLARTKEEDYNKQRESEKFVKSIVEIANEIQGVQKVLDERYSKQDYRIETALMAYKAFGNTYLTDQQKDALAEVVAKDMDVQFAVAETLGKTGRWKEKAFRFSDKYERIPMEETWAQLWGRKEQTDKMATQNASLNYGGERELVTYTLLLDHLLFNDLSNGPKFKYYDLLDKPLNKYREYAKDALKILKNFKDNFTSLSIVPINYSNWSLQDPNSKLTSTYASRKSLLDWKKSLDIVYDPKELLSYGKTIIHNVGAFNNMTARQFLDIFSNPDEFFFSDGSPINIELSATISGFERMFDDRGLRVEFIPENMIPDDIIVIGDRDLSTSRPTTLGGARNVAKYSTRFVRKSWKDLFNHIETLTYPEIVVNMRPGNFRVIPTNNLNINKAFHTFETIKKYDYMRRDYEATFLADDKMHTIEIKYEPKLRQSIGTDYYSITDKDTKKFIKNIAVFTGETNYGDDGSFPGEEGPGVVIRDSEWLRDIIEKELKGVYNIQQIPDSNLVKQIDTINNWVTNPPKDVKGIMSDEEFERGLYELDKMIPEDLMMKIKNYTQLEDLDIDRPKQQPYSNVDKVVADFQKKFKNSGNIVVVESIDQVPNMTKQMRDERRKSFGAWDQSTDTTYIIKENIYNKEVLIRTLIHETIGHRGVESVLTYNERLELYDLVIRALPNDPLLKKIRDIYKTDDITVLISEYVAYVSEQQLFTPFRTKVVNFFKKVFGKMGVKSFTDRYVEALILKAKNFSQDFDYTNIELQMEQPEHDYFFMDSGLRDKNGNIKEDNLINKKGSVRVGPRHKVRFHEKIWKALKKAATADPVIKEKMTLEQYFNHLKNKFMVEMVQHMQTIQMTSGDMKEYFTNLFRKSGFSRTFVDRASDFIENDVAPRLSELEEQIALTERLKEALARESDQTKTERIKDIVKVKKENINGFFKGIQKSAKGFWQSLGFFENTPIDFQLQLENLIGNMRDLQIRRDRIHKTIWNKLPTADMELAVQIIKVKDAKRRFSEKRIPIGYNVLKEPSAKKQTTLKIKFDSLSQIRQDNINKAIEAYHQEITRLEKKFKALGITDVDFTSRIPWSEPTMTRNIWSRFVGLPIQMKDPTFFYLKDNPDEGWKKSTNNPDSFTDHIINLEYDLLIADFVRNTIKRMDITHLIPEKLMVGFGNDIATGTKRKWVPEGVSMIITDATGKKRKYLAWMPEINNIRLETNKSMNLRQEYGKEYGLNDPGNRRVESEVQTYFLPEEVVIALNSLNMPYNKVMKVINTLNSIWKQTIIFTIWPAFNYNNMIGDLQLFMMSHPDRFEAIKCLPDAVNFLVKYIAEVNGSKPGDKNIVGMNIKPYTQFEQRLKSFMDKYKTIEAGEMRTDIGNLEILNLTNWIGKKLSNTATWREAVLRITNAAYMLKQIEKDELQQLRTGKVTNENKDKLKETFAHIGISKSLDIYDFAGVVSKELLINYLKQSPVYRRWITGFMFPWGHFYFQFNKLFHKWFWKGKTIQGRLLGAGIKASILTTPPFIAALFNNGLFDYLIGGGDDDERKRRLRNRLRYELSLPKELRNKFHINFWNEKRKMWLTWAPQYLPELAIGGKGFSILGNNAVRLMSGEINLKEFASNMTRQWAFAEGKGIVFLTTFWARLGVGLLNKYDPIDGLPVFRRFDTGTISKTDMAKDIALYATKVLVPFLSATTSSYYTKHENADVAMSKMFDKWWNAKEIIGLRDGKNDWKDIREVNRKDIFGNKALVNFGEYKKELIGRYKEVFASINENYTEKWLHSGQVDRIAYNEAHKLEWQEEMRKEFKEFRTTHPDSYDRLERKAWKSIKEYQKEPKNKIKVLDNKIKSMDEGELRDQTIKQKNEIQERVSVRRKDMAKKIRILWKELEKEIGEE